jgi:ubiquitin-protein ligase E3 A
MLKFTHEYESWGEMRVIELKPGGADISVTQENKQEYVDLFVDWVFNKSVDNLFKSFYIGFHKVFKKGGLLYTMDPEELEQLVCGSPVLDFAALKGNTEYEDGFLDVSPTIQMFWEIVSAFTYQQKKKFLFFCTGCDRAPINGLGSLKFTISRHGSDVTKLPSVHTCFNHLLLPDY